MNEISHKKVMVIWPENHTEIDILKDLLEAVSGAWSVEKALSHLWDPICA